MVQEYKGGRGSFSGNLLDHRRRKFAALSIGASYGGGQKLPRNLAFKRAAHKGISERLLANPHIQRIAGYASEGFAYYFPKSYHHVCTQLRTLHRMFPHLRWPFPNSIYTGVTFNFGPKTVSLEHNDYSNYPTAPCSITPLGRFDAARGGHLILFDLGIFVQLPAYRTALISSAGLRHGNTPIRSGEIRLSFTQWIVGGLMRMAAYGRPAGTVTDAERRRLEAEIDEGWEAQAGRLSNWLELDDDQEAVYRAEREYDSSRGT
ncbi:hypothetical protein K488DRAFT_61590 [Vararia minispora EC-137]|uniref:Uncharacterized protein n=1 Tax=Vararia minispora EC-137 TaxID=1314806 RepID=A0ACB8Q6U3_9AGAM|nr:hypothetical protein K488DRAFT_61590 [Vararia minispora EC-137]